MKTKRLFVFLSLMLLLQFCQKNQTETKDVEQLLSSYYTTMSDRDWSAYRDFFLEKATLTTIWQDEDEAVPTLYLATIDEFLGQTHEGPDSQPIFEERMVSAEIEIKGNLANAWVHYKAKFGSEDQLMEWEGIDHFSLIRHDGEWKIASLTYESIDSH